MKHAPAALVCIALLAGPSLAQTDQPAPDRPAPEAVPEATPEADERGLSLMERGARMFMEGILREMEPALDGLEELGPQLRSFAQEMGPALGDLMDEIKDWSAYHPPEIMPNGDIIIRRKTPEEMATPDPEPGEQIDI